MKSELLLVIAIMIVIAIIYFSISIYGAFITKKQISFSLFDLYSGMIIGFIAGATTNIYILIAAVVIMLIWYTVIVIKTEKNSKEKEIS